MTTNEGKKIFSILVFWLFGLTACNESLPLREEVSDLVTIQARSMYFTTSHSNYPGQIRIFITVINHSDETLDDISPMSGSLEIRWNPPKDEEGQFRMTKTLKLTSNNIFHAKYNRFTKRLTVDPGDSVVLSVDWDLVTDDGTDLFEHFAWKYDTKCLVYVEYLGDFVKVNRKISVSQNFLVKANIKLFDRLAVLYVQDIMVSQCFMFGHVGEVAKGACSDFIQFDPCSVIGQ